MILNFSWDPVPATHYSTLWCAAMRTDWFANNYGASCWSMLSMHLLLLHFLHPLPRPVTEVWPIVVTL